MNTIVLVMLSLFVGLAQPQPATAEPMLYDVPLSEAQQQFVVEQAEKYDLSPSLCLAVMAIESNFNTTADSGSSKGIMQLNVNTYPALAQDLMIADFDVYDFYDNTSAGIYKLSLERDYWKEQNFSDEEVFCAMLISYNRGRAGAEQYIKANGLEASYVDKVLAYKSRLEERGAKRGLSSAV